MPEGLTACKQESLKRACGAELQLEVMLTSATLSVALIGVISGLFGMNLHNTHEDSYDLFVIVRPWLSQPLLDFLQSLTLMSKCGVHTSPACCFLMPGDGFSKAPRPRPIHACR